MTLIEHNRGTHGDSSLMLSTVVLSNENQTCRGWEAPTSIGGGGCHLILPFSGYHSIASVGIIPSSLQYPHFIIWFHYEIFPVGLQ